MSRYADQIAQKLDIPAMSAIPAIIPAVLKASATVVGIGAAAYVARDAVRWARGDVDVSQGGTPHGNLIGKFMGYRHVLGYAATQAAHPGRVLTVMHAESDARKAEHELFQGGRNKNGYDNVADAYRHSYGSALMGWRLVREQNMSPDAAATMMRGFGMAHEKDSYLTGLHHDYSRDVDLHNNEAGLAVGLAAATSLPMNLDRASADKAISDSILSAIAGGKMVVLDTTTTPTRPTRARDLTDPIVDVPYGGEPSGVPSFTLSMRDAPQP